mmetsp:Transcript_112267/g.312009  ORF Transcript_112267/g.312009 Transcript_112267/m.312009 type:complete len:230 (-) Transcript_112267:43-732(-)
MLRRRRRGVPQGAHRQARHRPGRRHPCEVGPPGFAADMDLGEGCGRRGSVGRLGLLEGPHRQAHDHPRGERPGGGRGPRWLAALGARVCRRPGRADLRRQRRLLEGSHRQAAGGAGGRRAREFVRRRRPAALRGGAGAGRRGGANRHRVRIPAPLRASLGIARRGAALRTTRREKWPPQRSPTQRRRPEHRNALPLLAPTRAACTDAGRSAGCAARQGAGHAVVAVAGS